MTDRPERYDIDALLAKGEQPFDDLAPDVLASLAKDVRHGDEDELAVPVVIGADGTLIDGHQRLKAMRQAGSKTINARNVRVLADANASNALEWAVRLNAKRRHLTPEQCAAVARRLQRERRWSQGRIARAFGVDRSTVSKWLKAYPGDDAAPTEVVGADGRVIDTAGITATPKRIPRPKLIPMPWDLHKGEAFAVVEKLTKRLHHEWFPRRDSLTDLEWDACKTRLLDLEVILGETLSAMGVDPSGHVLDGTPITDESGAITGRSYHFGPAVAQEPQDEPGAPDRPEDAQSLTASVPCPHCDAPAGEPCQTAEGRIRATLHVARKAVD